MIHTLRLFRPEENLLLTVLICPTILITICRDEKESSSWSSVTFQSIFASKVLLNVIYIPLISLPKYNKSIQNDGKLLHRHSLTYLARKMPWVAAPAVRWSGIPKVARSRLSQCSKSCDLQPALQCAIRGAQGVLPCVGWGVRPVNWIYRLWRYCP